MSDVLLTIAIPTYNRVQYLREVLPIFLAEMDVVNKDKIQVQLDISNNASTDETESFLRGINRPDVAIYKNERNVGGDNNIFLCALRAKGRYVWVFGDDDLIEPHQLSVLLEQLENRGPALMILTENDIGTEAIQYDSYRECVENEMLKNRMFPLSHTLISASIFKRTVFCEQDALKYNKTNYGHMYALLAGLKDPAPVVILGGVLKLRKVRAVFAEIPRFLCVKQSGYLLSIASLLTLPRLKWVAMRHTLNLPLEIISYMMNRMFPNYMQSRRMKKASQP